MEESSKATSPLESHSSAVCRALFPCSPFNKSGLGSALFLQEGPAMFKTIIIRASGRGLSAHRPCELNLESWKPDNE